MRLLIIWLLLLVFLCQPKNKREETRTVEIKNTTRTDGAEELGRWHSKYSGGSATLLQAAPVQDERPTSTIRFLTWCFHRNCGRTKEAIDLISMASYTSTPWSSFHRPPLSPMDWEEREGGQRRRVAPCRGLLHGLAREGHGASSSSSFDHGKRGEGRAAAVEEQEEGVDGGLDAWM